MSKKELGIIPRLRWVITGIASVSLLVSVFYAAKGGVFAQDWGKSVPIYIIGTMGNFVEYIISEYVNGGNAGGAETVAFFIIGVVYAFFAVLAWAEYADSLPKN
ncbi:hypothetical protein [Rothia aeria]